jgi:hypothetical protein
VAKKPASYTAAQLAELAQGLRRLLRAIERDELTADAGTVARLEGAASTLEVLSEGRSQPETAKPG